MRVGLFAKQRVEAGVELTYDYNFEGFWAPGEEQACQCGAANCSQVRGGSRGVVGW